MTFATQMREAGEGIRERFGFGGYALITTERAALQFSDGKPEFTLQQNAGRTRGVNLVVSE